MKYLSPTQAGVMLGKNEKTIRRWIEEKKLQAVTSAKRKDGRTARIAIPESEVMRLKSELEQFTTDASEESGSLDTSSLIERIEQLEQDRQTLASRVEQLEQEVSKLERNTGASRETPEPTNATQPIDRPTHYEPRQKLTTEPTRATIAGIPDNAISISTFSEQHGVKPRTFRDHITVGIQGERITDVIERPKPSRPKETERYLTPEQQAKVLDYWTRHNVSYRLPEQGIASEDRTLPSGYVPLLAFVNQHHVNRNAVETARKSGFIAVERGNWLVDGQKVKEALSEQGRRDIWVQFHNVNGFEPCDTCPHKQEVSEPEQEE